MNENYNYINLCEITLGKNQNNKHYKYKDTYKPSTIY